ncbi:MAG: endonuclease VII domain-containing protein [Proteobacteria bacterium]|nr:endonuclease VII domain-containing protein [Pseudomonadota bacterium]
MLKKIKNKQGGLKQDIKASKMCSVHSDRPVWARGLCKSCYDKWLKQNNPEYLKKQKDNCVEWTKKNKQRKKQVQKEWVAKKDKDYNHIKKLRQYGLTIDDYSFMLEQQGGGCAICGKPPKEGKRLHVDHDHNCGKIRGLLCFRCNFGLSYFAEDYQTLQRASEYIRNSAIMGDILEQRMEEREVVKNAQQEKVQSIIASKT